MKKYFEKPEMEILETQDILVYSPQNGGGTGWHGGADEDPTGEDIFED